MSQPEFPSAPGGLGGNIPKTKQENYSNFGGINQKASLYLTNNNDCLNLQNVAFTFPGALNSMPGSAQYVTSTVAGDITGIYEYARSNGASYLVFIANTNAYYTDGINVFAWYVGLQNDVITSFTTFVDFMFMTDGKSFVKWDGMNAALFSAPDGMSGFNVGLQIFATIPLSGTFIYSAGYITDTGYLTNITNSGFQAINSSGFITILQGLTVPQGYGITGIAIYRSSPGGQDLFLLTTLPISATFYYDTGSITLSNIPQSPSNFFTLAPRYVELYQNSLFMIGSSQFPSDIFFSDLGQPESIQPTYNFEVNTNNGDFLTGGKFYHNSLYLFKRYSMYRLIGTDPTNFILYDVSDQYGCLSNRSIVVYDDNMLFLDRKGIAYYNGITPQIISQKVEQTFLTLNEEAAIDQACAVHNRLRNEIWWGIPTNGSTLNNTIIIYDYITNAWSVRNGIMPSSMAVAYGTFDKETVYYGSYSGSINYCSASLFNDSGNSMTFIIQSKFFNMGGPSSTMQYRRLFIDTDPIVGQTVNMTINFRINEQSAIVYTQNIFLDQPQTRLDFGIPAKSMSLEFIVSGSSFPFKLNGFTVEARLQRRV